MAMSEQQFKEYYEVLSQNALKGDTYLLKFKDDPNIYVGIPVLRANLSSEDDDAFTLNVLEPVEKKGVYQKSVYDLELLKPR